MALLILLMAISTNDSLPQIDKHWDFSNPALSEERFAELAQKGLESEDELYYLECLTQMARAQGLQQNFDSAHATLDMVQKNLPDDTTLVNVRYMLERGRVYNSSKARADAIRYFKDALILAQAIEADYYAVDAAHMLGIAEEPDAALEWNVTAIKMAEASSHERTKKWLGALYNNTGWTYHDREDYLHAQALFEKSFQWNLENGSERTINIAKWTIGRGLRSLQQYPKALETQMGLLDSGYHSGYVYEEIGELLLLTGDEEASRSYFKTAFEKLSEDAWLVKYEGERLERLEKLGGE